MVESIDRLVSQIGIEIDRHIARYGEEPNVIILSRNLHRALLMRQNLSIDGRIITIFGVPMKTGDIDGFVIGTYTPYELEEELQNEQRL